MFRNLADAGPSVSNRNSIVYNVGLSVDNRNPTDTGLLIHDRNLANANQSSVGLS